MYKSKTNIVDIITTGSNVLAQLLQNAIDKRTDERAFRKVKKGSE